MRWRAGLLVAGLGLAISGCSGGTGGGAAPTGASATEARFGQPVQYMPALPTPGFPEAEGVLEQYLALRDTAAMRRHAWAAWTSLTAASPSGLPTMLTWYTNAEVFGEGRIESPRLFRPRVLVGPPDTFGDGNPPTEVNFYDEAYRNHVRAHDYQWRDTLTSLVGQASNVVDFPAEALVVKTVWWPVRHDGLSPFPVWDEQPTRPPEWGTGVGALVDRGAFGPLTPEQGAELKSHELHGNEWGTFRRLVAIDPSSSAAPGSVAQVDFFDVDDLTYASTRTRSARVVPLDAFYTVRLTDAENLDRLNESSMGQVAQRFWGRPLTQQDSLALVAVHLTTRETPDWVWATFWWHDELDADRPPGLRAPFGHFRMAVTQSADVPVATDGGPNVTYNPYLEAGFSLGTRSNCLGCHQRAGWTSNGFVDVQPVQRGSLTDADFPGVLRTHFLWSLAFRPRARTQAAPEPPSDDFIPEPEP